MPVALLDRTQHGKVGGSPNQTCASKTSRQSAEPRPVVANKIVVLVPPESRHEMNGSSALKELTMLKDAKQIVFYEAFAYNPSTCEYDLWMGTAPLATIKKYGLRADVSYPLYGSETMCVGEWGYKAPRPNQRAAG